MTASESNAPAPNAEPGLSKSRVMAGAQRLLGRQVAGLVISVIGMFALARLIGPAHYGVYAAAFGITFTLQNIGGLNIGVYLKRREEAPDEFWSNQALTLLVLLSVLSVALSLAAVPLLAAYIRLPEFAPVANVMFASLPLVLLQQVPLARLERGLDYGRIGIVEIVAQFSFFAVALLLAWRGAGVWAPVAGWWTQQSIHLAGFWWRCGFVPRPRWRPQAVREILHYGIAATAATVIFSFRGFAMTLVVGRYVGATNLGYIALAVRLLEQLSLMRQVITRLAIPVFSQIRDDRARLKRALTTAAEAQFVSVAVPTVGFALIAQIAVPLIFGRQWETVAQIIPLLAAPYLAMGFFSMHNMMLLLVPRPYALIGSQGGNALALFAACLVLVPRFGIFGYAYAEIFSMLTWILSDYLLARHFPRPAYRVGLWWIAIGSIVALAPLVSYWLIAAAPLALAPRAAREELLALVTLVRERHF